MNIYNLLSGSIDQKNLEDEIYKNSPDKKKFVNVSPLDGFIIQDKQKPYQLEFRQPTQLRTKTPPLADIIQVFGRLNDKFRLVNCLSERAYCIFEDLLVESKAQIEPCFYEQQSFYLFTPPTLEQSRLDGEEYALARENTLPFFKLQYTSSDFVNQKVYDRMLANPLRGCYLRLLAGDEA
jgi:hypothetical protein